MTALSVDEALAQLGFRADGLVLSASRSERLPLDGMELTITTPKDDRPGRRRPGAGRHHDRRDRRRPARRAGHRAERDRPHQPLPEPGPAEPHAPAGLPGAGRPRPPSTAAVAARAGRDPRPRGLRGRRDGHRAEGVDGEQVTTYRVTVVDGVETAREDARAPRSPASRSPSRSPSAPRPRPANSPAADGLNWAALAQCESGGRPNAVSSHRQRYHGALPVLRRHLAGRSAAPACPPQASPDEQTYRAQLLYTALRCRPVAALRQEPLIGRR